MTVLGIYSLKFRIFIISIFSIAFLTANIKYSTVYAAPSELYVAAPTAILIDAKTGQVLYEKNSNEIYYPASTTKIMTAILALEMGNPDEVFTASDYAVNSIPIDGAIAGVRAGEQLSLRNLLNAMLVASANECANIIAEGIAGSIENFAELMNKKAKEIGATNTNFVNPHGLFDPNHYSTAADLAKMARYAMQIPEFREIVKKDEFTFGPTNVHSEPITVYTTNRLIVNTPDNPYYNPDVIGIKTGYEDLAGSCLVSGMQRNGLELIAVVLKEVNREDTYGDSLRMFEYGFNNYSVQNILNAGSAVTTVYVEDAEIDVPLNLVTATDITALLPNDVDEWNLTENIVLEENIVAPIDAGTELGYIEFFRGGAMIGKAPLVADSDVLKKPEPKLKKVEQNTFLLIFVRLILWFNVIAALFVMSLPMIRRFVSSLQKAILSRQHNNRA